MRKSIFFLFLFSISAASAWLWQHYTQVHELFSQYVPSQDLLTLEAHFTPTEIMESHRQELLVDQNHKYKNPKLRYYPYLLMDVEYTRDGEQQQGALLWSLVDGEMVLNTDTWEKTDGFEEAINLGASRADFKIIHTLAHNQGSLPIKDLQSSLELERWEMQNWIEAALEKHLVAQKGEDLLLNMQSSKLGIQPYTKIGQNFTNRSYSHLKRVEPKYSEHQVKNVAKAAFAADFAVKKSFEIYLPVYAIEVLNPDGSILVSYWNACNGQRLFPKYVAQN